MAQRNAFAGPLRAAVFLLVAVLAGGSAVVVLYQMFENYQAKIAKAQKPEDTVMALVATRDLYPGIAVREEDLMLVEIPPRHLSEGTFLSPEHVIGRIPRERVLANEFIRGERLSNPEAGIGLNAIIPRGMRAISIPMDAGRAVSGFLKPGNYVDLLMMESGRMETVMQAVFVMAVNSRMKGETAALASRRRGGQSPNVVLLVTAEQAEEIATLTHGGSPTLTLRNDLDVKPIETPGADKDSLMARFRRPTRRVVRVPQASGPSGPRDGSGSVQIIRGAQSTQRKVNTSEAERQQEASRRERENRQGN
jgi:pilus assembly protein CpaB